MAQHIQLELLDFNGKIAQETVRVGVVGTDYEIDLTTENAQTLRWTLAGYVNRTPRATTGRTCQYGQKCSSPSSTGQARGKPTSPPVDTGQRLHP